MNFTQSQNHTTYCAFDRQKMETFLNVSICHVVAESNRCVQGLATAERRAL